MGAVSFSIDVRLVELFRDLLPVSLFVETGTFEGDTVAKVLPYFSEIHTIESSRDLYARAASRYSGTDSVHVHHGDSPETLSRLRPVLAAESVLYWLDAHWCSADHEPTACPLLRELDTIKPLNHESVVLIDDARLFLCTPPAPEAGDAWPHLSNVLSSLGSLSSVHELMVINDVIVFYPSTVAAAVSAFAQTYSIDWLATLRHLDAIEKDRRILQVALDERLALIERLDRELKESTAGSDRETDDRSPARAQESGE